MPPTLRAYTVLAAALLLVSVGCGGARKDTGLPKSPTPVPTEEKGVVHATASNTFDPKDIKIKVGESVTWKFSPLHNAVADDGSFNTHPGCGAATITTKCSKDLDVKTVSFSKAGEYTYYCAIHGSKGGYSTGAGMVGKVIVGA